MNSVKRSVFSVIKSCRFSNTSASPVAALKSVPRAVCFRYSSYIFSRSLATAPSAAVNFVNVDNDIPAGFDNNMACPGNRLRWNKTASDIASQADELIALSKAVYDRVGALKPDQVSYERVIKVSNIEYYIVIGNIGIIIAIIMAFGLADDSIK